MVTAAIVINQSGKPSGTPSTSRDDLEIGTLVSLSNNDNTGISTWAWEIISKPPGSSAVLDTPTLSTCSFSPDVVGSYLVKLSVNGIVITDQRIGAIKTTNLGMRIPAAEETDEFGTSQGWAAALHHALSVLDAYSGSKVKVSVSDVISDYLQNKTEAGLNIRLTKTGTGSEKLNVSTTEHLGLPTQISDPTLMDNYGSLYTKSVDGYAELFYLDNYGSPIQITKEGCLFGTGIIANDELNSSGSETYISLSHTPLSIEFTSSGNDLAVYRNGVLMKYVPSLGSDVNEWTYDVVLNRVNFVASGEVDWYSVAYITRRFCNGGGSGGSLVVQSEGTTIETTASILNFIGTGLSVESAIAGSKVNIYVPRLIYAPYFNVGAAAISDISTYSRYVAAPTPEGSPFKIGDWTAGTLHSCTNAGTWAYTTGVACSFKDATTTLEVNVLDADEITPIATHLTAAITGNTDVTVDNIRIQVTSFQTDGARFKGIVTITIDIATVVANGGRVSVQLTHHNSVDYSKLQSNIFYDTDTYPASIVGGTVSISETVGQVVTKFISGVEHYTTGSKFTVDVSDYDYPNSNSYPATVLNVEAPLYALTNISVSASGLTGWGTPYNDKNDSYTEAAWTINVANVFTMSTSGIARAKTNDWVSGSYLNSTPNNILVDTYSTASTRLFEGFRDESWRCPLLGDFDNTGARSWDSEVDVSNSDAVFINGGCERNVTNFTIYDPNPVSQPNYSSGMDSTVYLIREFHHSVAASSGFTLSIVGSYNSLEYKLGKAWDGSSGSGTTWISDAYYNSSQWNNGNPIGGTGGKTSGMHFTFGTNNIINCNDTLYVKLSFTVGQRITGLSVVFD